MNGGKGAAQVVRQQIATAAGDLGKGAADEARNVAQAAVSQVTGTDTSPVARMEQSPALGQSAPNIPDPNQFNGTEQYRENLEQETKKRMAELKSIIEEEGQKARSNREQEEAQWQQAQEQIMKQDEIKKQEQEEKGGGILASLGRAAKRIKGRLGQVAGQGKGEKGKAAKG